MEKKPLIIRCSDGWIYGLFGYYEEAVEVAEQHIDGTEHTYVIVWGKRWNLIKSMILKMKKPG